MLSCAVADGVELRALEPWQAPEFAAHVDVVREHIRPWIPMAEKVFDAERSLCEVGVWIAPEHQGRGLVSAAVAVLIDWAVLVRGTG